ncbi:putative signal transduction protein with a C-terminal ATPase domain [Thermobacillus composti KWC4]|uniref:histidine kinase n=1 Tax=Thermobacillus composti (strain DSM 18247 / JCM 13945 / KWC4) TaxID=717605 RepID=L0EBS0_THECK|nr:sensor histidine kinase [Thermobacillus composti]AGA57074.1 putative signal transduction protein with a C-terminal ATPase domain [Thermobacillus composti KWC4]
MNRIQNKILVLTGIVLFIMAAIWLTLTYYSRQTQEQYNDILQRYLRMNEVTGASQQTITDLNNYLIRPTPEHYEQLEQSKERLRRAKYDVFALRNGDNDFDLTSYTNLIDSLLETANRSMMFQAQMDTEDSNQAFNEATRISRSISDMTLTLLDTELKTYDRFYRGIIERSTELNKLGIWLLRTITFLLLIFAYWFALSITRPVQKLTQAAKELSRGRFDQEIEVSSNDEIAFLAKMFERMRVNINNLITEIQQKAQLEHELQQNKLLLQESRYRSLQSQIHPHFLFNTLDTLSKKAYLEGAEETSDLLASVAGLLRYNLRRLDRSVTLYEEVRVLRQYMDIQSARFADRLRFVEEIDESCLYVQIPGLTLQPIVENAVIHAVEPMEDGGTIVFRIAEDGDRIRVEIADNGPGMPEDKIERVLKGSAQETEGHTTGIGIGNVVQRLRLFYGQDDIIDIESKPRSGTKVVLRLPKVRRYEADDQRTDRG